MARSRLPGPTNGGAAGTPISDWAFGLVDAERRPKPALQAVADVFSSVPFSAAELRTCPKVSVVVCAYNAADTLDECLTSLEQLTYPDFEVIVVNDGSRDGTGDIARRHASFRVIDLRHGGLSVARNAGLAAATGEIVAYTDADVRVDPDWLTYLVQPFLNSDVVAAGGLSLPPARRSVAGAVRGARARRARPTCCSTIAPRSTCPAATWRSAARPCVRSAGSTRSICAPATTWTCAGGCRRRAGNRVRPGGARLASPSRERRARIGGNRWATAKGSRGSSPTTARSSRAPGSRWKGHIYSPLPFVRSLSRPRVNTGIWGTAAFPSVYHMQAFSLALLPHTVRWQIASAILIVAALLTALVIGPVAATAVAAIGLTGAAITVVQCFRYALASDIESLPNIGRHSRHASRAIYRLVIAWLHLLQPFARATGQLRGVLSPPKVAAPRTSRAPFPSSGDVARALYLLGRGTLESRFWAERWIGAETLLTRMTDRLRESPLTRTLKIEDGWPTARDIRIAVRPFAWLDLLVLVEDHGAGRSLVRVGHRLRPAALSIIAALAIVAWTIVSLRGDSVIPSWARRRRRHDGPPPRRSGALAHHSHAVRCEAPDHGARAGGRHAADCDEIRVVAFSHAARRCADDASRATRAELVEP